MKKTLFILTALAGITLSGCAYDYYGHYGYGYGHAAYYGHEAYGYASPSEATTTTIYGASDANEVPLSAGEAAAPQMSTGEEVEPQMSTGEEAAPQMSTGEEAGKTDEKTAGDGQTP